MKYEDNSKMNFFSELSERQFTVAEFFSNVVLDSLNKNFGLDKLILSYYDTQGKFLSWINNKKVLMVDCESHPYRNFEANDIIRHIVFEDAVRDNLTYFDVKPRVYKSTNIIEPVDYDNSAYVRFLEENFNAHYSVTMPFGINAYVQLTFFKSLEDGDFTNEEMDTFNDIYVYAANSYKNYKKYEQTKIVSKIQNQIIASDEKAYLVTDDFMHIMNYNDTALTYLKDILGLSVNEYCISSHSCNWLPFLLGTTEENGKSDRVRTRIIKNYVFKIYTYDQKYTNRIIDRYHWITITKKSEEETPCFSDTKQNLTHTEQKVADLLYKGLTYKCIADELTISYHTVKKHVQNIYIKCGVNSRFELNKCLEKLKK